MAVVWIPPLLRDCTGGRETVDVKGDDVRQLVDGLERLHPGIRARLCDVDGLKPGLAVVVDGRVAPRGLYEAVEGGSEVHFLPAIGGG